jgi:hypothetical protein
MQDERLREDAKQLLRVARERRVVDGVGGMEVDLSAAAEHRGLEAGSPHLEALVDFMEVAGWVEAGSSPADAAGDPIRRVTTRGLEVLREA